MTDDTSKLRDTVLHEGDYLLVDNLAWFTVKGFSVRVAGTEDGVAVDIYGLGREMDDAIASAFAPDNHNKKMNRTIISNAPPYTTHDKPFFVDGCGHCERHKDAYIGSAKIGYHERPDKPLEAIDVYLFPDPLSPQAVCIRHSDDGPDYASPGSLVDLLISSGDPKSSAAYRVAADLICKRTEIIARKQ